VGLTVTGTDRTAARLQAIGRRAEHQQPVMRQQAQDAARRVSGVPVDTGRLARSIEVLEATDQGFKIGTRVEYARFVFEGTQFVDARPPNVPRDIGPRTARAMADDIIR